MERNSPRGKVFGKPPLHISKRVLFIGSIACGRKDFWDRSRKMSRGTAQRYMNDPKKRALLCKKCIKAMELAPQPLIIHEMTCRYCGSKTLGANGTATCPKGCRGGFAVDATWEIDDNAAPRKVHGPIR